MGLMAAIKRLFASDTSVANPQQWFINWMNPKSDSGVDITGKSVSGFAPVWYAVNKIGGHCGQLPLVLYHQDPNDRRKKIKAVKHPGYRVIKKPNELMTPMIFRETMTFHALLWGNGRAAIVRNNRNDPDELLILLPDRTKSVIVNDEKWHVITIPETGKTYKIPDRDVLHLPGLGFDGIQGYSLLDIAKNSFGMGLAAEKHGSNVYRTNGVPGLVLEAPVGTFRKAEEAAEFLEQWNEYHSGLDNAGRTALLRDGIQAKTLAMNGRDQQFVEQRKFQRQDAALFFLLEQILGDDSSVSYNSLEQKNLAYLVNCLMRWLVKWEQECNCKLLTDQQQRTESHYFKFTVAGLLRGTIKERYEVYQIGRMIGVMSANDVRELEDMEPIEGGDNYDNPAVKPNTATDSKDSKTTDTAKALIASRLRELSAVEAKRVVQAASKQKNFTAWLDEFYSEGHFVDRLVSVVTQVGGTKELAVSYAGESKAILLDVASTCSSDTFVSTVDHETSQWHLRADKMAELVTTLTKG